MVQAPEGHACSSMWLASSRRAERLVHALAACGIEQYCSAIRNETTTGARMSNRRRPSRPDFYTKRKYPFELRIEDFISAMGEVYDFFDDVNSMLLGRRLPRLDDMLRPAAMTGVISDMLTASMAQHSRALVENQYHNGHPDLIVQGYYKNDAVQSGEEGVEIKSTRKKGGAVDMHGARNQWLCVFVYTVDTDTQPARDRAPMEFTEVYLAEVTVADFRKNERGELGTRTATLNRDGLQKMREQWVFKKGTAASRRPRVGKR